LQRIKQAARLCGAAAAGDAEAVEVEAALTRELDSALAAAPPPAPGGRRDGADVTAGLDEGLPAFFLRNSRLYGESL
jgi:hypothetical protein